MTALDQALIKAFTRQNTSPLPISPRPAVQTPKQPQPVPDSPRIERDSLKPKTENPRRAPVKEQPVRAPSFSPTASVAAASPLPVQPSAGEPSRCVPLSATLSGVWDALGRPPRTLAPQPKTVDAVEDTSESEIGSYASLVESAVCTSDEPVTSFFTTTTIQPVFNPTIEQLLDQPATREPVAPAAIEQTATVAKPPRSLESPQVEPSEPEPAPSPLVFHPASATAPTVQREFKPGWQVDSFTWPKVCRRLIARAAVELDRLADALMAVNGQGYKVLAISGCHRGEGATTMLLCAARRLAERGIKPILVDADLTRPRLAKRLCLQPQFGWDETSEAAGRSLDQAIVEATTNNVALLPAREPSTETGRPTGDPSRLADCLDTLRSHYDMILVDLGPLEDAGLGDPSRTQEIAQMIDAVVLVHNDHITSESRLTTMAEQLADAGITTAGIVENFVPEE